MGGRTLERRGLLVYALIVAAGSVVLCNSGQLTSSMNEVKQTRIKDTDMKVSLPPPAVSFVQFALNCILCFFGYHIVNRALFFKTYGSADPWVIAVCDFLSAATYRFSSWGPFWSQLGWGQIISGTLSSLSFLPIGFLIGSSESWTL